MRTILMSILFAILICAFLSDFHNGKSHAISYPKVFIDSMTCSYGVCSAIFVNHGTETALCRNIELFADSTDAGKLSDYPDQNGQHCQSIDPGKYVVISIPDFCSKADRIRVITYVSSIGGDKMLSGQYASNYICK